MTDTQSFLSFVRELIADREDGANGWENASIENFLEAAVAWADDSDFGEQQNLPGNNPWKQFANFLYAGKIYE